MKTILKLFAVSLSFVAIEAFAIGDVGIIIETGRYTCESRGSRVCAVDVSTGTCVMDWSRRDVRNPMRACEQYIGGDYLGDDWGRSRADMYRCTSTRFGACAEDIRTGFCAQNFSQARYRFPMRACQDWLWN